MGFSTGGYNFELAALSKKATRGKTTSDTFVYVGTNGGSVDPAAAAMPFCILSSDQRDWFLICKLMASTSMKSMHLSMCRSTRRSSIQSRLILLGIDSSQSIPIHTWNLCSAWQDPSELSRCNRCERLGRCRRRRDCSCIRVFCPQEV